MHFPEGFRMLFRPPRMENLFIPGLASSEIATVALGQVRSFSSYGILTSLVSIQTLIQAGCHPYVCCTFGVASSTLTLAMWKVHLDALFWPSRPLRRYARLFPFWWLSLTGIGQGFCFGAYSGEHSNSLFQNYTVTGCCSIYVVLTSKRGPLPPRIADLEFGERFFWDFVVRWGSNFLHLGNPLATSLIIFILVASHWVDFFKRMKAIREGRERSRWFGPPVRIDVCCCHHFWQKGLVTG